MHSTIIGTGVDIIEVERIQQAIDRWGDHFLKYVFTDEEIAYARQRKFPAQHFAARFAAKEAIFKAVGNDPHLGWKDICVTNDAHGRPACKLGGAHVRLNVHLSLSHTKTYAVASAIITP